MRYRPPVQFFVHLLVGGYTALAYNLICSLLTKTGLRPGIASLIGYVLVIIPAYLGQKYLTFRSLDWNRVAFAKNAALQVTGNIAGFVLSAKLAAMGLPSWQVLGAFAVMAAAVNFPTMKYWTLNAHA